MHKRPTPWLRKLLVLTLMTSVLVSQMVPVVPLAQALTTIRSNEPEVNLNPGGGLAEIRNVGSVDTRYGLVAILVDEATWNSSASDGGGAFAFLGNTKVSEKVQTYAEDVQAAIPWTKTIIVTVDSEDTPVEIHKMLERFYFEGNPDDNDITQLSGVVVIGDVPLPVVNKNGYRFMSMLPYTDFQDPAYILDEATQDFLPNVVGQELQPEAWHGLIVPPVGGQEGTDLLSEYFNKNHAFHSGDEEYTTFDQQAFIGDFVTEEDTLNPVSFASYERYLDLWEEMVYYRYTNDLVEDIYVDLAESVDPGDQLDNDGDGNIDEEAANGLDDDGDGLIDEDIGDGFYGIDNDGDGLIDEDTFKDNNNDAGWVIELYLDEGSGEKLFEDRAVDEDPPGDVTGGPDLNEDGIPDGDGCPGICDIDDNGDAQDHDGDGYPTGWEILFGYDPFDERKPHKRVYKKLNSLGIYDQTFSDDDEATAYLEALFTDQTHGYQHVSCFDDAGVFHGEWDDDEDGFCDEDGSDQIKLWENDNGLPAIGSCAYNDADCDGLIDEDSEGVRPESQFDLLPDIQARPIVDSLTNRYAEIFDQPLGVWNRMIEGTGRYEREDYDSAISLIGKKDEYTLQYLKAANDALEQELNSLVNSELEESIPMVALLRIIGEISYEDAGGSAVTEDICTLDLDPSNANACLQFVNHSVDPPNLNKNFKYHDFDDGVSDSAQANNFYMYGINMWDINNAASCDFFAGTNEEDGQITEINALYEPIPSVVSGDLQRSEIKDRTNCLAENVGYHEDIPELCDPLVATSHVRSVAGAKAVDPEEHRLYTLDTGFAACYEFRELDTYIDYYDNRDFNDWLTGQLRRFRKEDNADDAETYESFLDDVEDKRANSFPNAGNTPERAGFVTLDLLAHPDFTYTVRDLFDDLGYEDFSADDIDTFMAFVDDGTPIEVINPQFGTGMESVKGVTVYFDKMYLEDVEGEGDLVDDMGSAKMLSSNTLHVEPTINTLNVQTQAMASPNLPIDATRRVSFKDGADVPHELNYVNLFDASSLADVEAQLDVLGEAVGNVSGGNSSDVDAFMDVLNLDQLEDALEWYRFNIDQKHNYVLTHYLGSQEPIIGANKFRDGFEIVSLIADGTADELVFAFNGSAPVTEADLEWNYRSQEAIDAALAAAQEEQPEYDSLVGGTDFSPVPLGEWVQEIQDWLGDINDSVSSFDTFGGGGLQCGGPINLHAGSDGNGDGIPDAAEVTVSLSLNTDQHTVLQANGREHLIVTVSAQESGGGINFEDNFTKVELEVISGSGVVEILGSSSLTMNGGIAVFLLRSGEEGDYTLRASQQNHSGVSVSNTLNGSVTEKLVKVTSYVTEDVTGEVDTEPGDRIEVLDDAGDLLALLDPTTGALTLRDGEAELREAEEDLPTRVAILDNTGVTQGVFYLIPDSPADVLVNAVSVDADVNGEELLIDGTVVGIVNDQGQIALDESYSLAFADLNDLNIYDPVHVLDAGLNTVFTVSISHEFEEADFKVPTGPYSDYLSYVDVWPSPVRGHIVQQSFGRIAQAATVIPDTDQDLLDDLEEWTIGTDINNPDTDGDGFEDGAEIFSGHDPLIGDGELLFTDIDPGHPAYHDLATLFLRGVIKGFDDGTFRPDDPMTREQFIKVDLGAVCVACDRFAPEYEEQLFSEYNVDPFPDTDINSELLACVAEAKVDDIISGFASGEKEGFFVPKQFISRAEATKVLVETSGLVALPVQEGEKWYAGYVDTANANNLFPTGVVADDTWLQGDITRSEFVIMAVNSIQGNDCRELDTDGDGLSDGEETFIYGTDPDSADTDGGGVDDLDEVLRDSNPLDPVDDFPVVEDEEVVFIPDDSFDFVSRFDHDPGLYVVSDNAGFEEIATSTGADGTSVNVFTREVAADGTSTIFVRAEIRDQSDNIYVDDNTSVIEFILSSEEFGEVVSKTVQVQNGKAETTFESSEVAGDVQIEARIADGSLPSQDAIITVYAGEPVRVALSGDSTILPAGAESVTSMHVEFFDGFNNRANNGFYTVTLEVEGGMELLDLFDEDLDQDGIQITTPDGFLDFRVLASPLVETSTVKATLAEVPGSGSQFSIEHIQDMQLALTTSQPFMFAGAESSQSITVQAQNALGEVLTGFQGSVFLDVSDAAYGNFTNTVVTLVNGEASSTFNVGTLAGNGFLLAESPGIESGSTALEVQPAAAFELIIRNESGEENLEAGSVVSFIVEAFDQFGNLVDTDSSSTGTLRATESTADFATLSKSEFTLNQGQDSFTVDIGEVSGVLNLVAGSGTLLAGTWGGDIRYSLSGDEIAEISPQMLYGSILGGPFGDVTKEDYVAGWMTFQGKTQAVTSLLSEPVPKKRRVSIDAEGSMSLPQDGLVAQSISGAGQSLPLRLEWRNFPGDELMAEVFYVIPQTPGVVQTELLSPDTSFELEEINGEVLLREDAAASVKIREDGQVLLMDPAYHLTINGAADGLGLIVLRGTEEIMRIDFVDAWDKDVTILDKEFNLEAWDTLSAGIYIRPSHFSEHDLVQIPTGNSSNNAMGIAIIDPNQDIAQSMRPSLGYASLEKAEQDGGIGWENENKHLLLFSAGNTVGQSNLYYPSEVGTVLGDPSISLVGENEVNDLGYTTDIGTMVAAGQEEILSLVQIDYNGDGQDDVMMAYADGRIDVLQNTEGPVRLQKQGTILFVENGIRSLDTGDFNGDGLEDLLIVTETACFAEEMCLYVYENIGGGFVAKNLTLSGVDAKPRQIVATDLNGDKYDDLVLVDENMKLYTVWNANGELNSVDLIKDFGLKTDPSVNLFGDVALSYEDLNGGSITLSVLSNGEVIESPVIDSDVQDFISNLSIRDDFAVTINGLSGNQTVTAKIDKSFESADTAVMSKLFTVEKNVIDLDGGTMSMGDRLNYSITVSNISGSNFTDFYLSDKLGDFFRFDEDSLVCADCDGGELQDGSQARPWIYGPISLANGEEVTLTYEATVQHLPSVEVMVGQDFYDDYPDDDLADLGVSLEGNTSGQLMLYYSDGVINESIEDGGLFGVFNGSFDRVIYREKEYSPQTHDYETGTEVDDPFEDADGDGIPDFMQALDPESGFPVPTSAYDPFKELFGASDKNGDGYYSSDELYSSDDDVDNDGLLDSIDDWISTADLLLDPSLDLDPDAVVLTNLDASVAAEIELFDAEVEQITAVVEDVVSALTCNGGCIAFPGSVAFLTPGMFHMPITGAPTSYDLGTPIFGILPVPPGVCTGALCQPASTFRIYISPTTTLGLGLAVCPGPWMGAQCFAYSVPLLTATGVCDAINGFIADSLSKATAFASEGGNKVFNVNSAPSGSQGLTGFNSEIFDSYNPPVAVNTNVQIPGFPSVFTEWWKAQQHEFFKMLDLPDVTFIYPDPASIASEFAIEENKEAGKDTVQLETDILGLEKFLNSAHAFPLIDIKPETVDIHYPDLTKEELEIIKRDWEEWVKDTRTEWSRFKEQFQLRRVGEGVSAAEEKIYSEIEEVIEEALGAMEANLAVLESYAEIPQQILQLRELQTYYAKIIICYLDAVLGFTAGYIAENADRIEGWAQWVVDLQGILDGWQVLMDLAIDLMQSCDKCTNQRYSGIQLLLSLFVFVPDFPVVEFPKLPDITIDVSNIQAGVDIVWPDLNFIPERLDIPEIPRFTFPSVYLEGDLDLDVNIPVLPEFPILFEIEPPGLPIPELPSLPPPPDIPELSPSIKASLDVASDILNVVCLVRSGFMPVPEHMLKSKIEDITERSGGIILPFDLAVEVEWPGFRRDFLEEIQVITTLNLTADFTTLFDVVDSFGDQTDEFVGDIMGEFEDELKEIRDQIQSVMNPFSGLEFGIEVEAEVEADLESYNPTPVHPAVETALAYQDHPMVQENLMALTQLLGNLQVQLDEWDESMPEEYTLVATQRVLHPDDPLLNRYDEIVQEHRDLDPNFIASIDGTPLTGVAMMRESLISYVEDFEAGTRRLENMDGESFNRYLAQENSHADTLLAAADKELSVEIGLPKVDAPVVLATEGNVNATAAAENLNLGADPVAFNTGIFIQNTEEGIATRLIDYIQEADSQIHILIMDIDDDGDDDVVYSMGGDVYIKENHEKTATLKYFSGDPDESTVVEMAPAQGTIKNIRPGKNNYEEASFAFTAPAGAVGYEALLYDSLDAHEADPNENVKRILMMEDTKNPSLPFSNPDGDSFSRSQALVAEEQSKLYQGGEDFSVLVPKNTSFILPDIKESRLVVDTVGGRVKLFDSAKRTKLTQNVEISIDEDVLLQTLKKVLLKVTIDGKTTNVELPAQTWIQFGPNSDRVIRVETGEVLWIEPDTILEEQDVIDGMEIFQDELIELESTGADVTLLTSDGAALELDKQESFVMDKLLNSQSPSSRIAIENGAYYTVLRGLFEDGSIGTTSSTILLNPQVCGDNSPPFPIIDTGTGSNDEIDLSIFATAVLSAESSFDSDSEIVDVYWDMDASVDVDGDGIANNDEEVIGFTGEVGPYDTIEPKEVTLWLTDAAGNQSTSIVTVNIFVPDLILEEATELAVTGTTLPISPDLPYHLVRDRNGAVTEIGDTYITDEDGNIYVDDLNTSDLMSIFNSDQELIAEFNPLTRQVIVVDARYDIEVFAASALWPTHLAVYEIGTGLVSASFILVSDDERFVTQLFEPLESYDLSLQESLTVHVLAEDDYEVNDSGVFGRDTLGFTEVTIAPDGSITLFDSRFELRKREAESLDEYLILELWDDGVLELEIWPGGPVDINILSTEDLDLPASPFIGEHESISEDFSLIFEDISDDDPLFDNIAELVEREILEGFEEDGLRYFKPDQSITRAEFTKIILSILCIIPGDDAYLAPPVFNDIQNLNSWYYPYTKESFTRDLITGYLGEVDESGQAPFKANITITRAEASKIVLEALDKEGAIEIGENLQGSPWYVPYIELALENGVITESESLSPNHIMTRYEFVEMAARVLEISNCFDLDSDDDGLINYDEEAIHGTDAYNPDTDDGGVPDGIEVLRGSDPLDPNDDFTPGLIFDVDPGIYAVQETCNACPCTALVDYQADIRPGDSIFAIIRNELDEIFSLSNSIPVTEPAN